MNENNLTALEIYYNRVFKFLIVILPSIALCAGLTFTVLHVLGFYPTVHMATMVVFDCSCVLYTLIGIIFNRRCEAANNTLKPGILLRGKLFIALMEIIQWNFITYMIPSRDFWAYSFFFVLLTAAFLDSKYLLIIIGEIVGSMFVSWIIRPELLLPVRDELFIPEIVLRVVLIILCFLTIWALTVTIEKRLVKELEKISYFDTLTLLYNRRKLDKHLAGALSRSKRHEHFSVIMTDIDDFKRVNDAYGHSCGDDVLRNIAAVLRDCTENRGLVFRYGGEEMLVLLYANEEETFSVAEKIRKRVEEFTTYYEEQSIKVTLTLGVASCGAADTPETLLKRADANLYYGKNHGKNCVIR